jgi:hypothetical protein
VTTNTGPREPYPMPLIDTAGGDFSSAGLGDFFQPILNASAMFHAFADDFGFDMLSNSLYTDSGAAH